MVEDFFKVIDGIINLQISPKNETGVLIDYEA